MALKAAGPRSLKGYGYRVPLPLRQVAVSRLIFRTLAAHPMMFALPSEL